MRLFLNRIVWPAFCLVLVVTVAPEAFAHAKLLRSKPAANVTLSDSPKTVELWFSEELESRFSTIIVTDQNGKHVDKNDLSFGEGNRKLQIGLGELPAGIYTVEWKALSTDEHTMKGKFTFTVLATTSAVQTASSPQKTAIAATKQSSPEMPSRSESMQESGTRWTQSIVRWFEYLAMMMLFGGFAFYPLVLKKAVRLDSSTQLVNAVGSTMRLLLVSVICVALLAVASFAELVMQASMVFDKTMSEALSSTLLRQLITQTGFGTSWLLQAVSIVLLLVIVTLIFRQTKRKQQESSDFFWWSGLVASGLLLVAPTLIGHAAAVAKEYPFAKTNDWVHLAAAGVWVGGLFHLVVTMPKAMSNLKSQDRLRVLHRVIPLFTRLAVVSTILIVLTGVYNSWMHVDGFGKLWSTNYGKTLSIKVLLVIPMLVLGGVNTFVIHPRASRLIANESTDSDRSMAIDRNFSRSVRIEAWLGVAVLFVASILVFQQPAREHPEDESRQSSASQPMER